MTLPYLLHFVTPFGLSLFITLALIPLWITVCRKWSLFDEPDIRKHHRNSTPSMGGIALFAGIFISFLVFAEISDHDKFRYLFGASVILFFTGFFDDLMDVPMINKLILQVVAATVAYHGGFRVQNLGGAFWIGEIPIMLQYPLTVFLVVSFTNAYNFIDGVDGLAGTLGAIIAASIGMLFFYYGVTDYAVLCFCITGALIGFLFFNVSPARIFMGDTGSLIIGFALAVCSVQALQSGMAHPDLTPPTALLYSLLFIPLFDITRVFVLRMYTGGSPFAPDRSHLHHLLLRHHFGHRTVTLLVSGLCLVLVLLSSVVTWFPLNFFLFLVPLAVLFLTNRSILGAYARLHHRIMGNSGVHESSDGAA